MAHTPIEATEYAARASAVPRAKRLTQSLSVSGRLRSMSLQWQMVLLFVVLVLVSILIVVLTTLYTISSAFRTYQVSQLETESGSLAQTIGKGGYFTEVNGPAQLRTLAHKRDSATNVWVIDAYGNVVVEPQGVGLSQALTQDKDQIVPALVGALSGQRPIGSLADTPFSPVGQRVFVVTPIYLNGNEGEEIVGALALSTPPRVSGAAYVVFQRTVFRVILATALIAVLLAVVLALLFSRRLTRPLEQLGAATARMAAGDYSARVDVRSPDELAALAHSFNEMATALQRDVDELERQELLRRELVANVSHELATPLTAISGFSEALLDGVVQQQEQRDETVRLIAREAARLRRLVDQLRQVTLYEAGTKSLERAPVQLRPLVDETLAVLSPELARKHVLADNRLASHLPAVYADGDRLAEVLLNLLDNALRHVPHGGRIEVAGAVEGELVRVSVADSGPGIAPEDRARIFDRFYRVDPSRSSTTGGSGLGLAIVRSLVEAHGGTIRVDEAPGRGACFSFTLPVAAPKRPRVLA